MALCRRSFVSLMRCVVRLSVSRFKAIVRGGSLWIVGGGGGYAIGGDRSFCFLTFAPAGPVGVA